jgi:hypothetical protein
MVAVDTVKPSGLHATLLETVVQIHTDIDRYVLVSPRASSRLEQRELRASREFQMGIPFLRLLERSKAGLVVELRFLAHGLPPLAALLRRDILPDLREMDAQPNSPRCTELRVT